MNNYKEQQILLARMTFIFKACLEDSEDYVLMPGKTWDSKFSGNKKIILYPEDKLATISDLQVLGFLLHEIAAVKYTTPLPGTFKYPEPKHIFSQVVNAFEDFRIENKLMYKYPGTYESFKLLKEYTLRMLEEAHVKALPGYMNLLINLVSRRWKEPLVFASKDVEATYNKIISYVDDVVLNSDSTVILVTKVKQKIWPYIEELLEEETEKKLLEKKNKSNVGDEEKEDLEESKKSSKEDKLQNKLNKILNTSSFQDVMQSLQSMSTKKITAPKMDVGQSKEQDEDTTLADTLEFDFENNPECLTYEQLYAQIFPYINNFASRLNSIMRDNNYRRQGGSYISGKLAHSKLFKLKCRNFKVFSRPILRKHKQYSVCLLVDESGSMDSYNKNVNAAKSAVLFAEVLNKCSIPFEVSAFNRTVRVYKNYEETWGILQKRKLEGIISNTRLGDAVDNNDAFAVNWANSRLRNRKGEKILIVLCDGYPVNSRLEISFKDKKRLKNAFRFYTDFDLKEEVKKASKDSLVIGVGISTDAVKGYYPLHTVLNDVADLPFLVMRLLKNSIKRG